MLSLRLSRKLKFSLTLWAREPINIYIYLALTFEGCALLLAHRVTHPKNWTHSRNSLKENRGDDSIRKSDNETNAQLKAFAKIGNFRSPSGRVSR